MAIQTNYKTDQCIFKGVEEKETKVLLFASYMNSSKTSVLA